MGGGKERGGGGREAVSQQASAAFLSNFQHLLTWRHIPDIDMPGSAWPGDEASGGGGCGMRAIGVLWSGRGCRLTTNCCGAHKEKSERAKERIECSSLRNGNEIYLRHYEEP